MKRALFLAFAALAVAGFFYTINGIFFVTPVQDVLFFNQKIFYYHVPAAFMLFIAVIVCGIYSLLYVRKRRGRDDDVAHAAAELAVVFGLINLVTGSIWAKAAWETWWNWDARQTTTLLLWMTMVGYVLVRRYGGSGSERLSAGLAIFAAVNVPLVYYSVRIWRTFHPKTSVVPGLEGSMKLAFWASVALFGVFFVLLLITRINIARGERQLNEARELGLDAGLFE